LYSSHRPSSKGISRPLGSHNMAILIMVGADVSRERCVFPGCFVRIGARCAGNVGGRGQCDWRDEAREGRGRGLVTGSALPRAVDDQIIAAVMAALGRRPQSAAGSGHGRRSAHGGGDANGAPPSMSRRGPT
jgi:hypothetical protein